MFASIYHFIIASWLWLFSWFCAVRQKFQDISQKPENVDFKGSCRWV